MFLDPNVLAVGLSELLHRQAHDSCFDNTSDVPVTVIVYEPAVVPPELPPPPPPPPTLSPPPPPQDIAPKKTNKSKSAVRPTAACASWEQRK